MAEEGVGRNELDDDTRSVVNLSTALDVAWEAMEAAQQKCARNRHACDRRACVTAARVTAARVTAARDTCDCAPEPGVTATSYPPRACVPPARHRRTCPAPRASPRHVSPPARHRRTCHARPQVRGGARRRGRVSPVRQQEARAQGQVWPPEHLCLLRRLLRLILVRRDRRAVLGRRRGVVRLAQGEPARIRLRLLAEEAVFPRGGGAHDGRLGVGTEPALSPDPREPSLPCSARALRAWRAVNRIELWVDMAPREVSPSPWSRCISACEPCSEAGSAPGRARARVSPTRHSLRRTLLDCGHWSGAGGWVTA